MVMFNGLMVTLRSWL